MRRLLFTISLLTAACGFDASGIDEAMTDETGMADEGMTSEGTEGGTDSGEDSGSSDSGSGEDSSTSGSETDSGDGDTTSGDGDTSTTGETSGSGGPECGNNVLDPGEQCDGLDFGLQTCVDFLAPTGVAQYNGGTLLCNDQCQIEFGSCTYCGDGSQNLGVPDEDCDGADLDGQSCVSLGYDNGQLGCSDWCQFDESECGFEMCSPQPQAGAYSSCTPSTNGVAWCDNQSTIPCLGEPFGPGYCAPSCTVDSDCADPELAECGAQPSCNNGWCALLCTQNTDCPNPMECLWSDVLQSGMCV